MSTLLVATFKASFPEYTGSPDALVQRCIDTAEREADPGICGANWVDLVQFKTARYLALSPYGRKMQLVNKDGSTLYDADIERISALSACALRVF